MNPAFNIIHDLGYRIWMKEPNDTYCYITPPDGEGVAYCQYSPVEGYTISSTHQPNRFTGTGYHVERHVDQITKDMVDRALGTTCPNWDRKNAAHVHKWRDIDHFLGWDNWQGMFREVKPDK